MAETFKAFWVEETETGFQRSIIERSLDNLPAGEVVINVEFSSLNYKDALSASGNRGVTRNYPHTPGIDAAGTVESSSDPHFHPGDPVVVMGYDLGMNTPGGFAEKIRVPADWVIHRPDRLSAEDAMVFGTAGFTAAMCVDTLLQVGPGSSQTTKVRSSCWMSRSITLSYTRCREQGWHALSLNTARRRLWMSLSTTSSPSERRRETRPMADRRSPMGD